jgi:hypothetical protein
MYTVHMAGIIYFHGCSADDKRALVPDGTSEKGMLHHASVWVEEADLDTDDWWKDQKHLREVSVKNRVGDRVATKVFEFRIPKPAELTFSDQLEKKAECIGFDDALPKLQVIDPHFVLDDHDVETIAQVPIRGGQLDVFAFGDASVVQWTVRKHPERITITAQAKDEKAKTITLKTTRGPLGTEVAFTNTPELIDENPNGDHDHEHNGEHDSGNNGMGHFGLYRKLEKHRDGSRLTLPEQKENLKPLLAHHDYIRFLDSKNEIGEPGCTPTCCRTNPGG